MQITFAEAEFASKRSKPAVQGRPAMGFSRMLRMYILQQVMRFSDEGTVVDAIIISAPPSIKNESKSRDPEMRHAKNCHASREAPQALAKNTAQLYSLFALANLFLSKRFMPLAG